MSARSKPVQQKKGGVAPVRGLHPLVCASGFAALVYQVLWMRQLGLLFGSTSQAAAATWAAFFCGLGVGSWWWGRRLAAGARPLRSFAGLEVAVAGCGLFYFAVLALIHAVYPAVHIQVAGTPWLILVRFAMALLLVFPAAFCMGGTLPAIVEVAGAGDRERVGRRIALLYACNTLGATLGVWFAAFVAIPALGCRNTYFLALLVSLGVAALAWRQARGEAAGADQAPCTSGAVSGDLPRGERFAICWLALISGLVVLGME
ncbi:MAG TPA: hypothetical protein VFY13_00405, partial [Luteolibacter sp.]|nr:hypothetical protein [Luteolibacter sp.]